MHDETTAVPREHRTFASFDALDGKVTRRVEVLSDSARDDGMIPVRGVHPLGATDEHTQHGEIPQRGDTIDGWVHPESLRNWYRPDRIEVSGEQARLSGLAPGLYADTRTRGRVRIHDARGHIGPDGRAVFRTITGQASAPVVDHPLPLEEAVRIVEICPAGTGIDRDALEVRTRPVAPVLAPGRYPDRAHERPGLPPAADDRVVEVRAFTITDGTRVEIIDIDPPAGIVRLVERDGSTTTIGLEHAATDLIRYEVTEPAP